MPDAMLWLAAIVSTLASLAALIKFLFGAIERIRHWVERSALLERVQAAWPAIQRLFQWVFSTGLVVQFLSLVVSAAGLGVSVWIALGPLQEPQAVVEIISPADGGQLKSPVTVQGTSSNIPSDRHIWVIVQPHLAPKFHPQPGPAPRLSEGEWSATAYLREISDETPDEKFDLIAVLATREASEAFTEYLDEATTRDSFPGLDLLPKGAESKDQVTVTLRRTSTPTVTPTATPTPSPTATPPSPTPTPTALRWRFETGSSIYFSPVAVEGMVYVASADYAHALDAATGEERWHFQTGGSVSSLAVVEGVVYGASDDYVYALDAATGEERWRFQTGDSVSSPALADAVAYVGSSDSYVYAVDAATGEECWRFQTGGSVSSPAVVDSTVYVVSRDRYVYALDARTGEKRWRFETGDYNLNSPAVVDSVVYTSGCEGVLALDAATGAERWHVDEPGCITSSPAVVSGVAYIETSSDVYALDAATGDELWRFRVSLWRNPAVVVVDGVVYVGGREAYVYALDASSGHERWRVHTGEWVERGDICVFQPGRSGLMFSATVAKGIVYIGSSDDCLYALDASKGEQLWRFETESCVRCRPAVVDGVVYFGDEDGYVYALDSAAAQEILVPDCPPASEP